MPIASNFTSIYSHQFEVNFTQCYPNGALKHTELCNFLQITAAYHAEMGGISFADMQQNNQAWVLSRMRLEINELPKWRDTITVTTWIVSLENSKSVRALEIFCNNKKMVGAESFWVVFNTQKRKPEALHLPFAHFELFPDKRATSIQMTKVALGLNKQVIEEKIVQLSDIDIVNHVNNVQYVEWCLDCIPEKVVLENKFKSLEMNFLNELSLHEKFTIQQRKTKSDLQFSIQKKDTICFALQINS